MDETPPTEGGLLSTFTQLLQILHETAHTRFELFLTELKEERFKRVGALLLATIAFMCGLMTVVMVTFTVIVVFWDSYRLPVLTLITLAYAVATWVAVAKLRARLQNWQAFSATIEEFKKDAACFKEPN